jgi:hypothetical protein
MPVARLVVVALLLCSALAFGQNKQEHPSIDVSIPPYSSSFLQALSDLSRSAHAPAEPWKIIPEQSQNSSQELTDRASRYEGEFEQMNACGQILDPYKYWPGLRLSKEQLADKSCYKVRSLPVTPDDALPVYHSDQNSLNLIAKASESLGHGKSESEDKVCFSIRSYVVARDSKDSDATHPVGSSTCQPASRYGVKSADLHSNSHNR